MQDVLIAGAARTPIGSFLGALRGLSAPQLGARAIRAALDASGAAAAQTPLDQVVMGNVLPAGLGQAPARQATLGAGLPKSVGAITLNKVCGSGMRAVMDAASSIRAGEWHAVVAGGMESMSNAPHLLERSREGFRMGAVTLVDSMIKDGLWDPYGDKHMGSCAELCAKRYAFSREAQDAFARESYARAQRAIEENAFAPELVAVEVPQRGGATARVERDEEPFKSPLEKMPQLKPAFEPDGTITAANASKLNDGAAALLVLSEARASSLNLRPLGRVVAQASAAAEPEWFTTAPIEAAKRALSNAKLGPHQIDRWEINEAFALVAMAAIRDLELDPSRVNSRGGAVALGHPIGASGARILVTLLHTLRAHGERYGCAAICIGGGEATAMVVEALPAR